MDKTNAFVKLGECFRYFTENKVDLLTLELGKDLAEQFNQTCKQAILNNYWFTQEDIVRSMKAIAQNMLQKHLLDAWLSTYPAFEKNSPKRIGIIMAGNIPMVGFHDLLCVLITGNIAVVKFSSKDTALMQFVCKLLLHFNPSFSIEISGKKMNSIDALIATGSNNTARYFESEYHDIPKLIRRNRFSVAVLTGNESIETLNLLAEDVFSYYGLGCRNISNLLIPSNYCFNKLIDVFCKKTDVLLHEGYRNSYRYRKAILKMNKVPYIDAGTVLLYENNLTYSSLASVYYEKYINLEQVNDILKVNKETIQCTVSELKNIPDVLDIGQTQYPFVNDYADKVDTIKFIIDSI